ncbi:50S ribosomal protein L15 [Candidatus Hepatincolaceae symbiont of Richtersius coronifer]
MKLNEIRDNIGATHAKKLVGRGIGSGKGKTSGKGHKGQKARGTGKVRAGFEGGQNPIYRRMPKRGFNNPFAKEYFLINPGNISKYIDEGLLDKTTTINYDYLKSVGLIKRNLDGIRIVNKGSLAHAIKLEAQGVSAAAHEEIKAKGGSVDLIVAAKFINEKKQYSK